MTFVLQVMIQIPTEYKTLLTVAIFIQTERIGRITILSLQEKKKNKIIILISLKFCSYMFFYSIFYLLCHLNKSFFLSLTQNT